MFTECIARRFATLVPAAPLEHGFVSVVPLLGASEFSPEYFPFSATKPDTLRITEVSDAGSVPTLRVENPLDVHVLIVDGQGLRGAKQNRILNTDVLVPPKAAINVPVSCVEQGRWHHEQVGTRAFRPAEVAPRRVRCMKNAAMAMSLEESGSFRGDQGEVWIEVASQLRRAQARSASSAVDAAFSSRRKELGDMRTKFQLPPGAVGAAVFYGQSVVGLDLFDKASTLDAAWGALLDGYALDWLTLEAPPAHSSPTRKEIEQSLAVIGEFLSSPRWSVRPSPGAGHDCRMLDDRWSASALVWDERTLVHLQVFPREQQERGLKRSMRYVR